MSDARRRTRWARRITAATLLPAGLVAMAVQPAYADPTTEPKGPVAPASGAIPVTSAPLVFPPARPQPAQAPVELIGPLAQQVIALSDATQRLGEQAKSLQDELAAAHAATEAARVAWLQAAEAVAASQSFGDQVGNPSEPMGTPSPSPTTQPRAPQPEPAASDADAAGITRADLVEAETLARATLDNATAVEQEIAGRHAVVMEQFQRHSAALATLTSRNNEQLALAQRARDAYEESLAASRTAGSNVNGLQAAPAALDVVAFALKQLGKPYVWATEGPDTYDCSGLVLASYLSVGVRMPRVANNQYGAGQPVLASQLLPGDLLFFSTDPRDWRQIHHVAIYIGHGQMVHAPRFGDVVKVSPIWWTEYFGATRMVAAVPVPGATPSVTPAPEPTASTAPTASPDPSPSPVASPSADPTPAGSPPSSNTPEPSPSPSPTPTPSPSVQPAPTAPEPTSTQTASTQPAPSPSQSPTPEPVQTPAVVPSSSATLQLRRRSRS
jgi:peptidoglycan DL-endopeptidase CwlO